MLVFIDGSTLFYNQCAVVVFAVVGYICAILCLLYGCSLDEFICDSANQ